MQNKTMLVVAALICGCLWTLAPGHVSARTSFIQAITQLEQSVPVAHRTGMYRLLIQLKAALYALPPSQLPHHHKAAMQDLLSCMAAYTQEQVRYFSYRRRSQRHFAWYRLRLLLGWYKQGIRSLLNQRRRLRRCLGAAQSKRWGQRLHALLDRKYLTNEWQSISYALPRAAQLFEALEKMDKQYQCKGCNQQQQKLRKKRLPQRNRRAKGVLLALESIFLRLKRQRHSHGLPFEKRAKVVQKLWALRPVHTDATKPVSAFLPLTLHISTSLALLTIGVAIGVEDWDKPAQRTTQSVQSTWGMIGGGAGILAATPALIMIMQPQPTHANVALTLLGGTLVPVMGISMLFSQQVETKSLGIGLLGSMPLQATWLILGWINQQRWHARQRQWAKPPSPPAATSAVSLHVTYAQ